MASSRPPSLLRTFGSWLVLLAVLGLVAVWVFRAPRTTGSGGASPGEDGPSGSGPSLHVRSVVSRLGESAAARGEAEVQDGEVWFGAQTLEEEIAQSEPEIVAGRVLDPHGAPVVRAWVRIALDDDLPPPPDWDEQAVETEDDGVFLFEELPRRVFRVIASRPVPRVRDWRRGRPQSDDETAWVERVVVEGVHAGRHDVRVRMPTPSGPAETDPWTVRVRVLGPDGKPVHKWSYTECHAGSMWSNIEGWIEPDGDSAGEVTFSGPGPYGLILHGFVDEEYESLPFAPTFVGGILPGTPEITVRLQPAGRIRGRVTLPPGVETANVVVRHAVLADGRAEDPTLVSDQTPPGAWRYDMTGTGPDGSFEFEGLPPGRVRLIPLIPTASVEDAPDDRGTTVAVGDEDVRLRLPAHARIRATLDLGAVADAAELEVTAHVLRPRAGHEQLAWSRRLTAEELEARSFACPPMPSDEDVTLIVEASAMLPAAADAGARATVAARRVARIRPGGDAVFVVLQRLPAIEGHVKTADGRPVPAGTVVRALAADVHPILRGAILGGDEDLAEFGGDLADLIRGVGVRVPAEPPVLPPLGSGVAGAFEAQTDAHGAFRFSAVPPGAYILWTAGPAGRAQHLDPPVRAGGAPATLVVRPTRRITGRVRAGAGAPVDGFVVEARGTDAPGPVVASSVVRTDGYFALEGLPEGAYLVTAWNARDGGDVRGAAYARVAAGSRRIAIDLAPAGVLAGHVVDAQGRPVHGARVEVTSAHDRRTTRVANDGSFRVGGLAGTVFTLRVELVDGRRQDAEVRGATEDLRLVVR